MTTKPFTSLATSQASAAPKPMSDKSLVEQFRLFLLGLSAFMSLGTLVELILTEHYKEPMQLVPFILCILSLAVVGAVLAWPNRTTLWALRGTMAVAAFGSLLGMWEHIESNMEVVNEVKSSITGLPALWQALHGQAPLLAPGILALAGILAIAATYYHPALRKK